MPPKKKNRGPKVPVPVEDPSKSPSPQVLSDNDEFNNSQADILHNVIRKSEEKDFSSRAISDKRMRKMIVEAFRLTFESRANISQDISLATHRVMKAYQRVLESSAVKTNVEAFYNEIDLRLTMMVEEITVVEHRARVFKMVTLVMAEMLKVGNEEMLNFLLKFIDQWAMSEVVAPRINVASLVSFMFETGSSQLPQTVDTFCGFSMEVSERLFNYLRRSLLDKEFQARVPAIRGIACIQALPLPSNWGDEAKSLSQRELLMRSFRDSSWECRLTALQSFRVKEGDVLVLRDIILYDKCLRVRLVALEHLGTVRPNRHVKDKVAALDLCLKDYEPSIRERAKDVMKNWVKNLSDRWAESQRELNNADVMEIGANDNPAEPQDKKIKGYILAGQALVLLWLSETPETVEAHASLRRLVGHLLDVIRKMYMCHMEPVNAFAETLMNDLRDKMMYRSVPILTKSTIGYILDTSEMVLTQDAKSSRALVFFWRCLIEYVADKTRNDGDRTGALMRFLCPMKTMVEHVLRILIRAKDLDTDVEFSEPGSTDELYIIQMSIVENLIVVMRHTERDQSGLDAYKSLLISMMSNPCYQKKIIDIVVSELSQFYADCPDDLMSTIYARMNWLRRSFHSGKIPSLEDAIIVGERMIREKYGDQRSRGTQTISDKAANELMDAFELMVVNSAMKVGLLKDWGQEYDDRYAQKLRNGTHSKNLNSRILAIECIGIVGTYDFSKIETVLAELIEKFDDEEDEVKAALIVSLTELCVQKELSTVDKVVVKNSRQQSVVNILTDIVMTEERMKESILLLRAVEGLAKILLHTQIDTKSLMWQRAVVSLMFRASYAITDNFAARIRSIIIVTLKFFCSLCKDNQSVLIKGFPRFFDMWLTTSNVGLLTTSSAGIIPKLKRCAATFVALTRHSLLPQSEQEKKTPTHIDLVNDILSVVTGSADSPSVTYYLYALQCINYSSFPRAELHRIYQDLSDYIAVHEVDSDRHNYNELRRVSKKVAKILGYNVNVEEMEEAPSKPDPKKTKSREQPMEIDNDEEGPSTSQAVTRKPKPQKPEQDVIDILQSPPRTQRRPASRSNTASRPPTSASVTRSAVPRSARKLRSDK